MPPATAEGGRHMASAPRGSDRELVERLKRLDFVMHRKLWKGLDVREKAGYFMVMARLVHAAKTSAEGMRISDLANTFGVTASGITQIVTNLEERGWVTRGMDPEDRRAVRVQVTKTGARFAEGMLASVDATFAGLIERLGPRKIATLCDILEEMNAYFDEVEARKNAEAPQKARKA
jgi:DNA-binding MarR family transcriptional regulator